MKHTPGPWHSMNENVIIPLKSVYCERLGFQIGFVNTDKKSVEAEAQANAYLISAAPDLLAALQAIAPFIPSTSAAEGGAAKYSANVVAADMVRAAIAKATGEQS